MPKTSSICAIIGAKGGTGKTSSAVNLAHLLSRVGRTVVIVDADPQGSLTRRCGVDRVPDPLTAVPVEVPMAAEDAQFQAGRVVLMPGGRRMEHAVGDDVLHHLSRAQSLGDLVIVDTPPAIGPIVCAAVLMADLVVIPTVPGQESLDGFADMRAVSLERSPATPVRAVLTMANPRSRLCRWSREAFDRYYPGHLFDTIIPFEMAAAESGTLHMPVTLSAPKSRAACAYEHLARELRRSIYWRSAPRRAPKVAHAR